MRNRADTAVVPAVVKPAAAAGDLTTDELEEWLAGIAQLEAAGRLFGTVGYFLSTARV